MSNVVQFPKKSEGAPQPPSDCWEPFFCRFQTLYTVDCILVEDSESVKAHLVFRDRKGNAIADVMKFYDGSYDVGIDTGDPVTTTLSGAIRLLLSRRLMSVRAA